MSPEEIKEIIGKIIDNKIEYYWIYLVLSAIVTSAIVLLFQYFNEKGKNYATKQDIADITRKIEEVKAEVQNQQEVEKQKRQLKYEALLQSLTLMDACLSHSIIPPEGILIKHQFATVEEARKCHNSLILTCEKTDVLEMFSSIMFKSKDPNEEQLPPTDLLNTYRNLVRKELGFGDQIPLDRENAWFASVNCEKQNSTTRSV